MKTKMSRMFLGRFVPLRVYGYMAVACVGTVWLELMGQQMLAAKGQENPATTGLWICVVFALWFSYFHTNLAVSLGVHPRKAHVGAGLYLLVVALVVVAIDLAFRKLFCQPVLGLKYILPFSLEDGEWSVWTMYAIYFGLAVIITWSAYVLGLAVKNQRYSWLVAVGIACFGLLVFSLLMDAQADKLEDQYTQDLYRIDERLTEGDPQEMEALEQQCLGEKRQLWEAATQKMNRLENMRKAGNVSVWFLLFVTGVVINQTWNIRWKNRGKRR